MKQVSQSLHFVSFIKKYTLKDVIFDIFDRQTNISLLCTKLAGFPN